MTKNFMDSSTKYTGRRGEDMACAYLRSRGYAILSRNFRWGRLEGDILASRDGYLWLFEVKTRTGAANPQPVHPRQWQHLRKLLNHEVQQRHWQGECGIRVILVVLRPPFLSIKL